MASFARAASKMASSRNTASMKLNQPSIKKAEENQPKKKNKKKKAMAYSA